MECERDIEKCEGRKGKTRKFQFTGEQIKPAWFRGLMEVTRRKKGWFKKITKFSRGKKGDEESSQVGES